jgi:hypothetical protein
VGGIGPPDVVQVGVPLGIGLGRGYQRAPVVPVDRHLLGQQEPRAQPRGLGAQGEHRRDAARWSLAGWSQAEDQVVAWLGAADECVAVGGVIDRGGRIADGSGHDGCLAGVAHSDAA